MSGSAIAQVLLIISAPILTRIFSPEDFGVFAQYVAIATIVSVIAALRYELAIVIPKEDKDGANVLGLSILIVLLMTLMSILVVFLISQVGLLKRLLNPEVISVLWWIPITILAKGSYQALTYWSTRKEGYKRLSISQFSRSSGILTGQLTGGFLKFGSAGLIGGQLFGQITAAVILAFQVIKEDWGFIRANLSVQKMKEMFKVHIDFFKFSTPQAFLNAISQNLPPIMLAFFYSSTIVGFYSLCLRVLILPLNIITEAVRRVFFQKAAHLYNNNGNLFTFYRKTTVGLGVLAGIPSLILIFWGPEIFSLIMGEKWHEAGIYSRYIVIWLVFGFMNPPSFVVIQLFNKQKILLNYEMALVVTRTVTLLLGGIYLSAGMTILLFSITGAAFNLFLITKVYYELKRYSLNKGVI